MKQKNNLHRCLVESMLNAKGFFFFKSDTLKLFNILDGSILPRVKMVAVWAVTHPVPRCRILLLFSPKGSNEAGYANFSFYNRFSLSLCKGSQWPLWEKTSALYIPSCQCPMRVPQHLNLITNIPTLYTHYIKLYHQGFSWWVNEKFKHWRIQSSFLC